MMPSRAKQKGYGCEDCGAAWTRKADVAVECRPYVGVVEAVPDPCSPGEFRWEWSGDEEPVWS